MPRTVVIVDDPAPFATVTFLPGTVLVLASLRVTVTVEVAVPSAVTPPVGGALTVGLAALGLRGRLEVGVRSAGRRRVGVALTVELAGVGVRGLRVTWLAWGIAVGPPVGV